MLDLNNAYAIAKYIKDAEKQTPVKIYVSTTAEIERNWNPASISLADQIDYMLYG